MEKYQTEFHVIVYRDKHTNKILGFYSEHEGIGENGTGNEKLEAAQFFKINGKLLKNRVKFLQDILEREQRTDVSVDIHTFKLAIE